MSFKSRIVFAFLGTLAGCAPTGPDDVVFQGTWGGDHVVLTVDTASALIEFDCAHGTLPTPISLDGGRFDVTGTFVLEHGGPIRSDETIAERPARYAGSVDGRNMTLHVRVTDTSQDIGSYTLTLGGAARVFKCL